MQVAKTKKKRALIMKIAYLSFVAAMATSSLVLSFASPAAAQGGLWVEGNAPSGEIVKVFIKSKPKFKYPRRAQRMEIEGYVALSFDVNEDGELVDLRVVESKPRLIFDKAATQYIQRLKFEPPTINGYVFYA
jgi:TonB family protein